MVDSGLFDLFLFDVQFGFIVHGPSSGTEQRCCEYEVETELTKMKERDREQHSACVKRERGRERGTQRAERAKQQSVPGCCSRKASQQS